ncbi:MAG: class I SAM-dependent methyltransferase [Synergistaceae bacterium]|nr:class I SAM-dependent methyltransferase [Synergistaceae bacterium]
MAVNLTHEYYSLNAESYAQSTVNADMSLLCDEFLGMLPDAGKILDLGCGSGRDSKYFMEHGREVIAVDGSPELCRIAGGYIGHEVICCDFREYESAGKFCGIWACASLLHLQMEDISRVLARLSGHLVDGGIFFMSFKHGNFSGIRDGRYYTDMNEAVMSRMIEGVPALEVVKMNVTRDVRGGFEGQEWLGVFCAKV